MQRADCLCCSWAGRPSTPLLPTPRVSIAGPTARSFIRPCQCYRATPMSPPVCTGGRAHAQAGARGLVRVGVHEGRAGSSNTIKGEEARCSTTKAGSTIEEGAAGSTQGGSRCGHAAAAWDMVCSGATRGAAAHHFHTSPLQVQGVAGSGVVGITAAGPRM
eukprot:1159203-Pelagomonas_calceolata.AAC.5